MSENISIINLWNAFYKHRKNNWDVIDLYKKDIKMFWPRLVKRCKHYKMSYNHSDEVNYIIIQFYPLRIILIYFFSNVAFNNTTNLKYTVENEILTTFVRSIWHNFNCTILQSMHFSKINNVFTDFTIFISRLQMCRISLSSKTVNFFAKPCNLLKNNECWC